MSRTTRTRTGLVAGSLAGALALAVASPAGAQDATVPEPSTFTSAFTVMATPDQVVDTDGEPAPGTDGATGTFDFRINSDDEIICYDITVSGITLPYESPARTATHIHEAEAGSGGPPRLAFPDPTDNGDGTFSSRGCMQGPFTTGLGPEGSDADHGDGFSLAQIEANPAGFSADTHTAENPAGAVRGQLSPLPVGRIDTGAGGLAPTSGDGPGLTAPLALAGLAALGGAGLMAQRRFSAHSER
ncbi:MAG: CHRD domain-containing protein [Acidimicrobiales bacterium]